MRDLPTLLDRLEEAGGPTDPVPSADGWELVLAESVAPARTNTPGAGLAESVAYLVDDQRRWHALDELRRVVGLQPEQILAAPSAVLLRVVAGVRPAERVERLRRCAELAIAGDCPSAGHPPPLY